MFHFRSTLFIAVFSLIEPGIHVIAQNLDSLLSNKRIYCAEPIGDLPVPRIDGLLDDEVWSLGEWHGNFTQQQPVGGVPGTEKTFVKVLYDRSNLFVSIVCQDSEPELIRDIFDRRDALSGDMTGIAIDSYFDKRTAFEFNLSAAGQKMDLKHLGDYQWDFNWNGVWDGATSKNDTGWIAEMKIPFSQLRYTNQEQHIWGMHVWRWISRRYEEDQWQYIPREAPAMVYLFGELKGVDNIRGSRQVELLPYASAAFEKEAYMEHFDRIRPNAGIDAKVGISSDYTLDLSINPDFGQVEADPSVLNLTSFETFYEEKRPFFMEGNEIFDFDLEGDIPYYSRRIGSAPLFPGSIDSREISEIPDQTTILGAAKLTGKGSRGLSAGIINGLTAQEFGMATSADSTQKEIQISPLTNYLATRVKKEFSEGNTIAGGMFSLVSRMGADSSTIDLNPSTAITVGTDLLHYWNQKNYFFEVKALASQLKGTPGAILQQQLSNTHRFQRPDAGYLEVDSLRDQLAGHGGVIKMGKKGGKLNFEIVGQYRSPGLNLNDMGYIRQADFIGQGVEISYEMNEPGDWIRNYVFELKQEAQWSFGGESTLNRTGAAFTLMNNRLWRFDLSYSYDFSHLDTRELRGGPALKVDGEHLAGAFISTNSSKDLYGNSGFHYNVYGGNNAHQEVIYAGITWLPVRRLKFGAQASFNNRQYHQQYVSTLEGSKESLFVVGHIVHRTASFTFRGELFFTPELSLQYYASPYYAVGDYDDFKRVSEAGATRFVNRTEPLDVEFDAGSDTYSFTYDSETWSFQDPDISFMQFRSNLVFRWEYSLGSTLYLVWAHDRWGQENEFHPVSEIAGDLFQLRGSNIFMIKLNFWFSV
jgi:hypothetical protein